MGKWLGPLKQHHENCSHSRYSAFNYCLFTLPSSKHLPPTTPHTTSASNPIPFCTTSFLNSLSFYCTYLKTWAFIKWFKSPHIDTDILELDYSDDEGMLLNVFISEDEEGIHTFITPTRAAQRMAPAPLLNKGRDTLVYFPSSLDLADVTGLPVRMSAGQQL